MTGCRPRAGKNSNSRVEGRSITSPMDSHLMVSERKLRGGTESINQFIHLDSAAEEKSDPLALVEMFIASLILEREKHFVTKLVSAIRSSCRLKNVTSTHEKKKAREQ
jgi:hypothetical protein